MAKFDNAKVGDKVFSTVYGWGKVFSVDKTDVHFPLVIEFDKNIRMCYRSDGTTNVLNKFPNLFWNEVKLPNEEEDRRFDLVKYLKENLQPVEFNEDKFNYFLTYNARSKELEFNASMICIDIHLTYFHLNSDELKNIEKVLNDNKVTIQQLKQAYKILNWL